MTAVVFDFDGVLVDTEPLHLRAFQDAFAPLGWTLEPSAYAERYLGYDDLGLIAAYGRDHGLTIPPSQVDEIMAAKSAAFRVRLGAGSVLFPEAPACVAAIGAKFPLAIASGALRAEIEDILQDAGLRDPFQAVVGADDVPRSKPAPDCYLRAAELLGVAASSCVAVEDTRGGLASARAAGMRTIAVTTTCAADELDAADRIIDGLTQLTVALVEAVAAKT
jgi:beta-phosphoglucomutase